MRIQSGYLCVFFEYVMIVLYKWIQEEEEGKKIYTLACNKPETHNENEDRKSQRTKSTLKSSYEIQAEKKSVCAIGFCHHAASTADCVCEHILKYQVKY